MLYLHDMRVAMYQGALTIVRNGNIYEAVQGITIIPLTPYLISCHRRVTNGDATFYFRVEKLSDGSFQEGTSDASQETIQANPTWRLGVPNTHFHHYMGALIIHNGEESTHVNNSRNWLRSKHGGTIAEATENTSIDAEFNVVLNISGKQ